MEQINLLNPFEEVLAACSEFGEYRVVWVYGEGYFLVHATIPTTEAENGKLLSSVVVDQLISDQHLIVRRDISSRMRKVYTITESGREIVRQTACFVEPR